MSALPWNHNIHYHDLVLRSISPGAARALDVGCGTGLLARQLAARCQDVVAIDADPGTIARARAAGGNIEFVQGDVMTHPFSQESFDFISVVAALHHLPLRPALTHLQGLLKTGGVLTVIGLYRNHTIEDYGWGVAGLSASRMLRLVRNFSEVTAPIKEPEETLHEIRGVCDQLLPGSDFERRLLFRYSLIWRKP